MTFRHTAQITALLTGRAPSIIRRRSLVSAARLAEFDRATEELFAAWTHELNQAAAQLRQGRTLNDERLTEIRVVCEEVLIGELLTRVWTALMLAAARNDPHAQAVIRGVFVSQLSVRRRVLIFLSEGVSLPISLLMDLDRTRRQSEKWADLMLGRLSPLDACVLEFAHDPDRARDFAAPPGRAHREECLVQAGLRLAVGSPDIADPVRRDLHRRVWAVIDETIESGDKC